MKRGFLLGVVVMATLLLGACQPRAHRMVSYQPIDAGYGYDGGYGCRRLSCGYRDVRYAFEAPYRYHVRTRPPRIPWWVKEELVKIGLACAGGMARYYIGCR